MYIIQIEEREGRDLGIQALYTTSLYFGVEIRWYSGPLQKQFKNNKFKWPS